MCSNRTERLTYFGGHDTMKSLTERRNYVCRVAVRIFAALLSVLAATLMDQYDLASDADEERRTRAVAEVMALQYAQGLRYMRRREQGLAEVCADCGDAIDAERRREYPLATVCRECARGDGE